MVSSPLARSPATLAGLVLLCVTAGCAGTRSWISAPDAVYPVSFSPSVRDASGRIVADDELERVGEFQHSHTTVHMLFSLIPLSRCSFDLSQEINDQVTASGGQAIVNLRITDLKNGWNMFSAFPFLGLVPAYNDVTVTGQIVKLTPQAGR